LEEKTSLKEDAARRQEADRLAEERAKQDS